MKNTFGNAVSVTLFGESHGDLIGAVLDGLAPGVPVDPAYIERKMRLRRAQGAISTARMERDEVRLVSGVYEGKTTGAPITALIANENTKSADYLAARFLARPGHADYTAFCRYSGYEDPRGGGHFSGRLTAPLVAAGAIAAYALERKRILIGTHILRCACIEDAPLPPDRAALELLNDAAFAVLDKEAGARMREAIEKAREAGDSVGGVLETCVLGLPAGVGEPWFDSVESTLSHALFSIPAVKGVEFGDGFALADLRGSEANDSFYAENGEIRTRTNRNGGLNGGITNGMPLTFRCAVKPTPSIALKQDTVDFLRRENAQIEITGRHDPAVVHRARVVADSVTALVLCDLLTLRFGPGFFREDAAG